MRVNQAHNALYNSLNQAMQEPGFNTHYLEDMKLWVTHSQFIVEHINAMTTTAREHTMLTPDLAQRYLESCEIALQRCQQRLDSDGPGSAGDANIMESPESEAPIGPLSTGAASATHSGPSEYHAHHFISGMASAAAPWHLAAEDQPLITFATA